MKNVQFVSHLKLLKLDCSSDTDRSSEIDSSSENAYSSSEGNSDNLTFYCLQINEKKINKSKVNVTFKDTFEMFKDDIKAFKEHIYIKRRQINAHHEIKASLSESD